MVASLPAVDHQEDLVPTYQYACTACDHSFDAVQSFTEDSLTDCPQCAGRLRKVFSAVGVVFKGSGFYRTDSRPPERANGSSAKDSPADKPGSKDSAGKDSGSKDSSAKEPASVASGSNGSGRNKSKESTGRGRSGASAPSTGSSSAA